MVKAVMSAAIVLGLCL